MPGYTYVLHLNRSIFYCLIISLINCGNVWLSKATFDSNKLVSSLILNRPK